MNQKYYFYYKNGLENYLKCFKEKLREYKDLKFVVLFYQKDILNLEFDELKQIISNLSKEGVKPNQMVFSIKGKNNFSNREWEKVEEINNFFKNKNIEFGFEDLDRTFTPFEVLNAKRQINEMVKPYLNKNLSPFEKLVGIYSLISNREFIFENENEHYSQSRSIYGVLNSDKIVCVGYSSLLKELMHKAQKYYVQVFGNNVGCSKDGKTLSSLHRNLIVYCKDKKYGIDGYYYLDPTWDRSMDKDFPLFNFFMVPLSEIENIDKNDNKIRSFTLPYENLDTFKKKSKKAKEDKIFNGYCEKCISFTSDEYSFNKIFLYHFLENFEDAFNVLKELMISEDLFDEDNFELMDIKEPLNEITTAHMVKVIESSKPMQRLTQMLVMEKSPVVDFNNVMLAYSNVLKKLELGFSEKEISKIIDLTTKFNLESIRDNFNNNSKVSLLEHLRTYENVDKTL